MPRHKHLRRLDTVWIEPAIYFITVCVKDRRPILARPANFAILRAEFATARVKHRWRVGRFVVMPDHVHFFCSQDAAGDLSSISRFVGAFKEWTAKAMIANGVDRPIWQKQFFDHLLRSSESYCDKWLYVRENPVRAGLVADAGQWPYAGEIEPLEM